MAEFVDKAKIQIKAGTGGNGAVSFHREKYVAAGGPDGGDGGRGGNVVFVADTNLNSLLSFRYKKRYFAPNGENGKGARCSGKNAEDLIIKVPKGTVIREAETGRVLADLSDNEKHVVAKGGKGGWGNVHFATPTRQIPRFARPGLPGEEMEIELELKLLADVGLAGFPNVGKSTLISAVSAAKPTIANYHFTTLTPVLGVVKVDEETTFVMADIPGMIEGASQGTGLGHEFLRHVDRCRLIVHVVDISGCEGRDPKEDFEIINHELEQYNSDLLNRPMLVAGNKCDIATQEQIEEFKTYIESKGYSFYPISAAAHLGTKELIDAVARKLAELPPLTIYTPEEETFEQKIQKAKDSEFKITKTEDGVYLVEGAGLIPAFGQINLDDYESLQYFERVLIKTGIIEKLEAMGIQDGETVSILGNEFEYMH